MPCTENIAISTFQLKQMCLAARGAARRWASLHQRHASHRVLSLRKRTLSSASEMTGIIFYYDKNFFLTKGICCEWEKINKTLKLTFLLFNQHIVYYVSVTTFFGRWLTTVDRIFFTLLKILVVLLLDEENPSREMLSKAKNRILLKWWCRKFLSFLKMKEY